MKIFVSHTTEDRELVDALDELFVGFFGTGKAELGPARDELDTVDPSTKDLVQPLHVRFREAFQLFEAAVFEGFLGLPVEGDSQDGHASQGHGYQGEDELGADVHSDRIVRERSVIQRVFFRWRVGEWTCA